MIYKTFDLIRRSGRRESGSLALVFRPTRSGRGICFPMIQSRQARRARRRAAI